jgi:hypothetical protein
LQSTAIRPILSHGHDIEPFHPHAAVCSQPKLPHGELHRLPCRYCEALLAFGHPWPSVPWCGGRH